MNESKINEFIDKIKRERQEQTNSIGQEYDLKKRPNDWVALLSRYVVDIGEYNTIQPIQHEFERSLVIIATIAMAAYECSDNMIEKKYICADKLIDIQEDIQEDIVVNENIIESVLQIHGEIDDNNSKENS